MEGIIIGISTFLIIGLFHPVVIKAEYYWGTRCWWIFLILGILGIIGSILIDHILISSLLGVFAFSSFSCLIVTPMVLLNFAPMTLEQTLFLLGGGAFAAGGQFSITGAYRCAPAREISVYDYSQVIFAAVLGFFLFGDRPDLLSVLGYIIICSMAVLNFLHNNKKLHT
jgi:drug/metabolite transporter (DMT)-like permease